MNRKRILLAASALAVIAAIPLLIPQQLLAQVRAALVRDVDSPARDPVLLRASFDIFGDNSFTGPLTICWATFCGLSVPSNKRLVIESMNVQLVSHNPLTSLKLETRLHTVPVSNYLYVPLQLHDNGANYYQGGNPVRIYADPSSQVNVTLDVLNVTLSYHCYGNVTGYGYLVDLNVN